MNQQSNDGAQGSSALWRNLGIGANIVMLFVVLGSFGSCLHWEGKPGPLAETTGWRLEAASASVIIVCGFIGVLGFAMPNKGKRESIAGIALTVLWGIVCFVLATIFWFGATCGPPTSFCELWRPHAGSASAPQMA